MSVYDEFEGVTLTHRQALRLLAQHQIHADDVAVFLLEHGVGSHDAQAVLAWLGY